MYVKNLCFFYMSSDDHFYKMNYFNTTYVINSMKMPFLIKIKNSFYSRIFLTFCKKILRQLKSVLKTLIHSNAVIYDNDWLVEAVKFSFFWNLGFVFFLCPSYIVFFSIGFPLRGANWSCIERTVLLSHLWQVLSGHQRCYWFCGMDILRFFVNHQVSFKPYKRCYQGS
jgi:hypothetical protein